MLLLLKTQSIYKLLCLRQWVRYLRVVATIVLYIYIYIYIYIYCIACSCWILGKTTVLNINILYITHIPISFTDQILDTQICTDMYLKIMQTLRHSVRQPSIFSFGIKNLPSYFLPLLESSVYYCHHRLKHHTIDEYFQDKSK